MNASRQRKGLDPKLAFAAMLVVLAAVLLGPESPVLADTVVHQSEAIALVEPGSHNLGWPVTGRVTQKFWERHHGVDVAAATGSPVYAADAGVILSAAWDDTGYGNLIQLDHGNGFVTRYAHLSAFAVQAEQQVRKGQLIGRVGSTGRSTGPHLHFEIIFDRLPRDPFQVLR